MSCFNIWSRHSWPKLCHYGFFNKLLDMPDYQFVIGGDFNQVCDVTLDKSTTGPPNQEPPSGINSFISDLSLIDPCAYVIKQQIIILFSLPDIKHIQELTTYLCLLTWTNGSISLTYFLSSYLTTALWSTTFECSRAPINADTGGASIQRYSRTRLKNNLKMFLEINSESASSPQILWETTKCLIRGKSSSFASYLKASRKHRIVQLESEIQMLESDQKHKFSDQTYSTLLVLKFELKTL